MATLTDNPEFTANEVYELTPSDVVEGAAVGAAFNGIGASNWPHQQLANRTAFLYQRQQANMSNIAALQAWEALFTGYIATGSGLLGAVGNAGGGYLKIGYTDTARGSGAVAVVQWGMVDWGSPQPENLYGPYSFPIPFPNAVGALLLTTLTPEGGSGGNASGDNIVMVSAQYPPTKSQFWVWNNSVAPNAGGNLYARGFHWLALGY